MQHITVISHNQLQMNSLEDKIFCNNYVFKEVKTLKSHLEITPKKRGL